MITIAITGMGKHARAGSGGAGLAYLDVSGEYEQVRFVGTIDALYDLVLDALGALRALRAEAPIEPPPPAPEGWTS